VGILPTSSALMIWGPGVLVHPNMRLIPIKATKAKSIVEDLYILLTSKAKEDLGFARNIKKIMTWNREYPPDASIQQYEEMALVTDL